MKLCLRHIALLFAVAFVLAASQAPQNNGLPFEKMTLDLALEKAQKEGKGVFLIYMAPWCGVCHHMKGQAFQQKDLIAYYRENFICVKFNNDKVFTYPSQLTERSWETLPAMFYFNRKGELIRQVEGLKSAEDLLDIARSVLN